MNPLPGLAASTAPAAILLLLSLFRSTRTRFEAPFVFFSLFFLARLSGELAAAFLFPGEKPLLIILPNQILPALASWPLLAGLLRFVAAAYGAQGTEGRPGWKGLFWMGMILAVIDLLCIVAAAFPAWSPFIWLQGKMGAFALGLALSILASLALALLALAFFLPRRARS